MVTVLAITSTLALNDDSGAAERRKRQLFHLRHPPPPPFFALGTFEVFFGDAAGRWRIALLRESSVVPASAITEPGQALHPK